MRLIITWSNLSRSNLPFLGKMIERAVGDQFQVFLDNSSAIDPFQSSSTLGYGMEKDLLILVH